MNQSIDEPKEAYLYQKKKNKAVKCKLCNRRCDIKEGTRGFCGVRENKNGTLCALTYEKPISTVVDPIEKKPLFHFMPGTHAYSIATVGCNFKCEFCQNWSIAQPERIEGYSLGVEDAVGEAKNKSEGIAYTYTEPTVFFEYAYDIAEKASKEGLYNVFVSNGYMTPKAIEMISKYLDAINIDLKAFNNKFYRKLCKVPSFQPVLDSIRNFHERDVHVEVTYLIIPGWNESEKEIRKMCEWLAKLDSNIPLHFSKFFPQHNLKDVPMTPKETLEKAYEIAKGSGINYVYLGNLPHKYNSTFCHNCGEEVINRRFFSVKVNLSGNKCPTCGEDLPIIQ